MTNFIRFKVTVILMLGLLLTGCASTNTNNQKDYRDPLEPMNRAVFNFNEMVDNNILEPVARGYKKITPDPIELVVGNFFSNLNDVVVLTNSILQLNYESALASSGRLLINTTFGIFGMIDIASDISAASDINLTKRNEDFGQTLGRYGVGSGPYIVLPFLGPSSLRDTVGIGVDGFFMDPVTQGITGVFMKDVALLNSVALRLPVAAGRTINTRAQLLDAEKTLEEAALDKYEFMRDAYIQRRTSLINNTDTKEVK